MRVSVTSRTAVYGPVRTVVWEGRSREAPPYPDLWRNLDIAPSYLMSVGTISSSLSGRNFAEFPHLLCLSIASSSSSSDRGEMPSTRNPGKLSEAVVSICISST